MGRAERQLAKIAPYLATGEQVIGIVQAAYEAVSNVGTVNKGLLAVTDQRLLFLPRNNKFVLNYPYQAVHSFEPGKSAVAGYRLTLRTADQQATIKWIQDRKLWEGTLLPLLHQRLPTAPPPTPAPGATAPAATTPPPGTHRRPPSTSQPAGELWQLWNPASGCFFEITGESHCLPAIQAAHTQAVTRDGSAAFIQAWLQREPHNPHDPNAIAVMASTGCLGYIPRYRAPDYCPELDDLTTRGQVAAVEARLWTGVSPHGEVIASVKLNLGDPGTIVPANDPPAGDFLMLPERRSNKVSLTDNDVLLNYRIPEPGRSVYTQLQTSTTPTGKPAIEVHVDEQLVGHLSPTTAKAVTPLIEKIHAAGKTAVAAGHVTGNRVAVDMQIRLSKASDVTDQWLNQHLPTTPSAGTPTNPKHSGTTPDTHRPPPAPAQTHAHPPAWYPDPTHQARLRWWDGNTWTDHVHN